MLPQRLESSVAWWNSFVPSKNDRELKRIGVIVDRVNTFEAKLKALPDDQLAAKTDEFKARFAEIYSAQGGDPTCRFTEGTKEELKEDRKKIDKALDELLPEAFAVVREAAWRILGMRHYDVQILGGVVMHEGKIAEMRTGEGKTLMATLAVYLNAIAGRGVHLVTVNEYLAARDAEWMGQVYGFLGMTVGVIVSGKNDTERQEAYKADITYGTNSEFGFDYLRDNMKLYLEQYAQRGAHFAIVDEVDSILIDEARTPLIISGAAEDSTDKYLRVDTIIPTLKREQDYTIDEKSRSSVLTERGITAVEKAVGVDNLYEPDNIEILHHINQALRAHTLYKRDVDYMVDGGKVKIIDEFTGRVLDGRRWSDGLHQAVEAKEGVAIENENRTTATITYQNYFRQFLKLSGMTGTAETEAEEFNKIYELSVVVIPTNKPIIRDDNSDQIFATEHEKFQAIAEDIQDRATRGQPILVGTVSVEKSEVLSKALKRLKIPHSVLNAKFHEMEAEIVAQAGSKSAVTIATNMAGRGTDILLGGNPEFRASNEANEEEDPEGYAAALKKHIALCAQEKQEVLDAGGLHIIGTERHESRRIDNQLRGRSGRQGDPGSSRFYLSLDDELMRIFGGDRLKSMMNTLGMKEGEVIEHKWVNKSIEGAQRRVEGQNFDIRKNLIEYDDVMNEQRKSVYKLRRDVLGADEATTKELLLDRIEDVVIDAVIRCAPEKTHIDQWNVHGLGETSKDIFGIDIDEHTLHECTTREALEEAVFGEAEKALHAREHAFTSEAFYHISRIVFLQTIDSLWKDHLTEMTQLREGIGLRGYAQKDPKQEYKKEGYNIFASMMATVSSAVLQKVYRVVISEQTEDVYEERLRAQQEKQKANMRLGPAEAKNNQKPETVRRQEPKVGRNDPCPCGSGKKYKKCHGAAGAQAQA